jgi:hypothetical protein
VTKSLYHAKGNLKGLIFVIGILLIISGIWYSQKLVNTLKKKSTEYVSFRIKVFEANINNPNTDIDLSFFFNEVIKGADYPIIYTDTNYKPQSCINISAGIDSISNFSELSEADSIFLISKLQQMTEENDPIPIKYQGTVLGYYFYGYSPVIYKLRVFPYLAIGSASIFILLGYLGFSYIKKSEQQLIWVGMAKETAHQLGTPLSSISGWLELLMLDSKNKETAVKEMGNDLNRLNKVANRFSKIGSYPELKPIQLKYLIDNVISYFHKRLPNTQKKVVLKATYNINAAVNINEDLFEWVLENLFKNAIDSIGNKNGLIEINVKSNPERKTVYIDISDNGKGILPSQRKNIFKPGFSTKKRGWGLGLSLARRIIEDNHGGKLILKESKPGSGSVFRIILKI